jgi:hypothetical protein
MIRYRARFPRHFLDQLLPGHGLYIFAQTRAYHHCALYIVYHTTTACARQTPNTPPYRDGFDREPRSAFEADKTNVKKFRSLSVRE